jgi:hypothetical protein
LVELQARFDEENNIKPTSLSKPILRNGAWGCNTIQQGQGIWQQGIEACHQRHSFILR